MTLCICASVHLYLCLRMCVCMSVSVCLYVCMSVPVCLCACDCVSMWLCSSLISDLLPPRSCLSAPDKLTPDDAQYCIDRMLCSGGDVRVPQCLGHIVRVRWFDAPRPDACQRGMCVWAVFGFTWSLAHAHSPTPLRNPVCAAPPTLMRATKVTLGGHTARKWSISATARGKNRHKTKREMYFILDTNEPNHACRMRWKMSLAVDIFVLRL